MGPGILENISLKPIPHPHACAELRNIREKVDNVDPRAEASQLCETTLLCGQLCKFEAACEAVSTLQPPLNTTGEKFLESRVDHV